jgi:hypothetical protein
VYLIFNYKGDFLMFDRTLTMRIDKATEDVLKRLIKDFNSSKAEIVRKALRILKKLSDIQVNHGEIVVKCQKTKKEMILVLLDK